MPCCEISDCAQISKTIIAVRHFELGSRESLETAVNNNSFLRWQNNVFDSIVIKFRYTIHKKVFISFALDRTEGRGVLGGAAPSPQNLNEPSICKIRGVYLTIQSFLANLCNKVKQNEKY